MSEINREIRPQQPQVPPLDRTFFRLSDEEKAFLHSVVSTNDDELHQRIFKVQEQSYEQYPYPCIRAFHFVWLMMRTNAVYSKVVAAGKEHGDTIFLDLGCCMGTDVRKLVQDGYPARKVLGCDLRQDFIEIGHTLLFQDKAICPIRFFASDVLALPLPLPPSSTVPLTQVTHLEELSDRVTHLYTGALFHLFDEPTQYALALRVANLVKRQPGAIIFGRHQGLQHEGDIQDHMARNRYGHSPESWTRLWKKVFTEIESAEFVDRTHIEGELRGGLQNVNAKGREVLMLYWSVSIL